jgi:CubicO group peptidase (beta-lactamase class C family)
MREETGTRSRGASRRDRALSVLVVAILAGAALVGNRALAREGAAVTPAGLQELERELESLRVSRHLPGLAAAVVHDHGQTWMKGYGFADVGDEVAVTTDTPFWIASLTKTFVGLLFLKLEEAGVVDLADRLHDVPEEREFCRDLAASGSIFGRDLRCDRPITISAILHHTVNGEPGTRFLYNPIMYSRLSRYLEHKSGRSVRDVEGRQNTMAQLVETHILAPAGMTRTMASQWQREKMDVFFDMAQGYGSEGGGFVKRPRPERSLKGGGGIVSTVADLARYDVALDAGRLASPAVMRKLFTPARAPDGSPLPYAFGWYVQTYRGVRLAWHSGWDEEAGFSAMFLKVPDHGLTLILLANGEGVSWQNPLDRAAIETSPFAQAFLNRLVLGRVTARRKDPPRR